MAAFLNRGLGRGAVNFVGTGLADDWATFDSACGGVLTAVDLQHGGGPGGTGHVLVTANVSAYTTLAGTCPCELAVWAVNADTGEESSGAFQFIADVPAPPDEPRLNNWYEGTASVSYLFTVDSGVTNTYLLAAEIRPTTSPTGDKAGAEWNITAVYIPFGATGDNPRPRARRASTAGAATDPFEPDLGDSPRSGPHPSGSLSMRACANPVRRRPRVAG